MATPFEVIHQLNASAWKAYLAWERELVAFSTELSEELCVQLDWDRSAVRRVQIDGSSLADGARACPGGFADAQGYNFILRFDLGNLWTQRGFTVRRGADKGAYLVKCEDLETVVSLADHATVAPIVSALVEQLRATVLNHALASVTGFVG
jgi:hypothetical protein